MISEEKEQTIKSLRNTVMEISDQYDKSKKEFELLEAKIDKVRKKMENLKLEKSNLEKQIHKLRTEKKCKEIEEEKLEVSDHAVVRYMKRVIGFDVDNLRQEIIKGKSPKKLPDGKYPLTHNNSKKYVVVVKNNIVVTVLAEDEEVES